MYGIPNMKLSKDTVDRRVDLLRSEGIEFVTNADIGKNIDVHELRSNFDALALCIGATMPRDLPVPGRDLKGVHFAMEFLTKNQKRLLMTRDGNIESAWSKDEVRGRGRKEKQASRVCRMCVLGYFFLFLRTTEKTHTKTRPAT